MTEATISYTITSKDPNNYNVIRTNLQPPISSMCKLTLTGLTTKACFILLNTDDYIEIDGQRFYFIDEYSEITTVGFADLLSSIIHSKLEVTVNLTGRLCFRSDREFIINDMSYNVKLISGFYDMELPTKPSTEVTAISVGLTLSTPVLYIISNLGSKCYDNKEQQYCDRKILMRINNSFTANYSIVNSNVEFSSYLPVYSLSNIEFRLVDANLHDIKLLCPMYLSATVESVEVEEEPLIINNEQK